MNQNIVMGAGCWLLKHEFKCVIQIDLTAHHGHCAYGNQFVPGWIKPACLYVHDDVSGRFEGSVQVCSGQGQPVLQLVNCVSRELGPGPKQTGKKSHDNLISLQVIERKDENALSLGRKKAPGLGRGRVREMNGLSGLLRLLR